MLTACISVAAERTRLRRVIMLGMGVQNRCFAPVLHTHSSHQCECRRHKYSAASHDHDGHEDQTLTNENDVLRDEGEAYAHKLRQAEVPVIATRYLGAIHDLLLLNPIAQTPVTPFLKG
jgi:hypothetical protein